MCSPSTNHTQDQGEVLLRLCQLGNAMCEAFEPHTKQQEWQSIGIKAWFS